MNPRTVKIDSIIADVIMLAIGIVLIALNQYIADVFVRIIGGVFLLVGILGIVVFLLMKEKSLMDTAQMVLCVIVGMVGVFFLVKPGTVVTAFNYIFGAVMILYGLVDIVTSLGFARQTGKGWWVPCIFGLISVALGCIVIFAKIADNVLVIMTGISLVIAAIGGIVNSIRIRKMMRQVAKQTPPPPPPTGGQPEVGA